MGRQNHKRKDKIYRLTITEDDTHHSIIGFRFTKFMLTLLCITVNVTIILLIYSIIAFTPLRTTIPGYPDSHSKKEAVANAIKIDSLQSCITRWELYAENLSRILSGESTVSFDSIILNSGIKYISDKTMEELRQQDSLLLKIASENTVPIPQGKSRK